MQQPQQLERHSESRGAGVSLHCVSAVPVKGTGPRLSQQEERPVLQGRGTRALAGRLVPRRTEPLVDKEVPTCLRRRVAARTGFLTK